MFAQDELLPEFERRFREEVLDPYEQQTEAKLSLIRQHYPQATKVMAIGLFFLVGLALNKALSGPRETLEERLETAAERLAFWSKPKQKRRRRRR